MKADNMEWMVSDTEEAMAFHITVFQTLPCSFWYWLYPCKCCLQRKSIRFKRTPGTPKMWHGGGDTSNRMAVRNSGGCKLLVSQAVLESCTAASCDLWMILRGCFRSPVRVLLQSGAILLFLHICCFFTSSFCWAVVLIGFKIKADEQYFQRIYKCMWSKEKPLMFCPCALGSLVMFSDQRSVWFVCCLLFFFFLGISSLVLRWIMTVGLVNELICSSGL